MEETPIRRILWEKGSHKQDQPLEMKVKVSNTPSDNGEDEKNLYANGELGPFITHGS